MTGSGRPSPEPLLKKEAPPAVLGGDNSGNALEASNALNYSIGLGHPSRTLDGNSRKRFFPESFRNFFRKVPAVLGVWPKTQSRRPLRQVEEIADTQPKRKQEISRLAIRAACLAYTTEQRIGASQRRVLGRVLRKLGVLEGVLARVLLLSPFQGQPPPLAAPSPALPPAPRISAAPNSLPR